MSTQRSTQNDLPPLPRRIWWPWDEPARRVGFYRAFRVVLAAHTNTVHATLYVSASGPFCAWVDDRCLPDPDDPLPSWRVMRRFAVELTPGRHAIHILAASGEHGQPFVLACLDWRQPSEDLTTGHASGKLMRIGTDDTWHAVVEPPLEWMPDLPQGALISPTLVPESQLAIEVDELDLIGEIDAWRRAFPPGLSVQVDPDLPGGTTSPWEGDPEIDPEPNPRDSTTGSMLHDYRTTAFESMAETYGGIWAEPWGMPADAPDDFCRLSTGWQVHTDEPLTHVSSLHQGLTAAGTGVWAQTDGGLRMRPVAPFAQSPPRLDNKRPPGRWHQVRAIHSQQCNSWLDQYEARAPHAVLDAGENTFGRVRVRLKRGGPVILALTTGESIPEIHRYDRRATDVFTLSDGESFVTTPTGFRFVKLIALSSTQGMLDVEPLVIQHIRHPVEPAGQFKCSDPILDDIWEVCAHTLHLCMQNEIWDGTKRDQLPWMGELVAEALSAYHVFGDARLVRRSLAVLAELGPAPARPLDEQVYPGLQAVWKTEGGELNGIPAYTLWWVVGLADYVRYTGDRSLAAEYVPELLATLRHIARHVASDGLWHLRRNRNTQAWTPPSVTSCETCLHLLACLALAEGTKLAASLGRLEVAEYGSVLWEHLVDAARRAWFGSDLATLRSAPAAPPSHSPHRRILDLPAAGQELAPTHHAYAMAIRSGCLSSTEAAEMFDRLQASVPPYPMTYWHRYADLEAAAQVGQIRWGLDYLRQHWGSALMAGMPTLWETFDPSWLGPDPHGMSIVHGESATYGGYRTAHCYGGAAGPAAWLHRAVLGVTPAKDGFAAIRFSPALGDLEWAEGSIPSPHGPIYVSLRQRSGARPSAEITVPKDVELQISPEIQSAWEVQEHRAASPGDPEC